MISDTGSDAANKLQTVCTEDPSRFELGDSCAVSLEVIESFLGVGGCLVMLTFGGTF